MTSPTGVCARYMLLHDFLVGQSWRGLFVTPGTGAFRLDLAACLAYTLRLDNPAHTVLPKMEP